MIVYLKANTNNSAATVFQLFLGAVEKFGLPSRVRSDKGGENVDIARYILSHPLRGADRGSHRTPLEMFFMAVLTHFKVCLAAWWTLVFWIPLMKFTYLPFITFFCQGLIADSPSLSMDMPEHQLVQNTISPLNNFGSQA